MNYKKATILVAVDYTEILSISAIDRHGQLTTLFNHENTISPWYRKNSVQKELDNLLRWLSGNFYKPHIILEDETAIIYDINFTNVKSGAVYRQPYCKGR